MSDQNGWIRKRHRKLGDIWVYCHRRRRWDRKRVEATGIRLGNVSEIPNEEAAWKRVDALGLKPYSHYRPRNPRITFGEVAAHSLGSNCQTIRPTPRSRNHNPRSRSTSII